MRGYEISRADGSYYQFYRVIVTKKYKWPSYSNLVSLNVIENLVLFLIII